MAREPRPGTNGSLAALQAWSLLLPFTPPTHPPTWDPWKLGHQAEDEAGQAQVPGEPSVDAAWVQRVGPDRPAALLRPAEGAQR